VHNITYALTMFMSIKSCLINVISSLFMTIGRNNNFYSWQW